MNRSTYLKWKLARDNRGYKRKQDLINNFGGKCETCGYSRCNRSLVFHHKNENTKKFTLDVSNLTRYNLTLINNEAAKCNLLCQNCHQIHHEKIDNFNDSNTVKRNRYKRIKKELIQLMGNECFICKLSTSYLSCMTFHHLKDKLFDINSRTIRDLSKTKLLDEMKKCVLLCFNCHMEVEQGITKL